MSHLNLPVSPGLFFYLLSNVEKRTSSAIVSETDLTFDNVAQEDVVNYFEYFINMGLVEGIALKHEANANFDLGDRYLIKRVTFKGKELLEEIQKQSGSVKFEKYEDIAKNAAISNVIKEIIGSLF